MEAANVREQPRAQQAPLSVVRGSVLGAILFILWDRPSPCVVCRVRDQADDIN